MKKQILFSTRTCKHESGLDSENRNKLQRAIAEECDRATAAEEELLLRLQGVSEDSNPVTDPFKFLGTFSTYDEFNSAISTLACLDVDNSCGYFRARVVDSAIDIKNMLLSSEQNIIGQLVQGMLQVGSNGELASANSSYKLYFRKYQDGDWDEWEEVTGGSSSDNADLSDYVTTETFRSTTNQLMGYADRGDAAVKNSLKTINGQSIIKSSSDDSDNIEITGGDGNIDLSGYVTDAEFASVTEKLDGIEEGANKYTHPSEGNTGTYAAYNPEDFFQDAKILFIPTLTVNKYGHVTAAGENQVALPTFKTINGASIIKTGTDDSDNIEITGGDGNVDLSGYVTDAEFTPIKEKVDGIEEGANKYTHPSEGNTGTYAAYNPENFFQDVKTLNIPTLTVNKYGHVTAAGVNQVALPTFKTINGASIIKTGTDDSDNIEITGGDGNVDLSGYVTDAEFTPIKEKVDGIEEGANKYTHPSEGNTGTYAAYNPENFFQDIKVLNIPTLTVNKYGHVTAAGENQVALPTFKTINGASIIKTGSDDSDNIEITGGDGNIDLSGYVTDAEFTPVKEKVDGIEEGANKYTHPSEGNTGTYAAYNPEDFFQDIKVLNIPTLTVNKYGHVTAAGENQVALPTFKTINGASIIKTGTDDSDNIEITGGDGNVDLSGYLTKSAAESTYLKKTANAASATKATQDGSGNVITSTYATKTELNNSKANFRKINGWSLISGEDNLTDDAFSLADRIKVNNKEKTPESSTGTIVLGQVVTDVKVGGSSVVTVDENAGTCVANITLTKGDKGEQGEKGDTGADGEDGVGITSVKQTTTSTADGGNNVITVTLSDGTTSTFNVKNGSKGSQGEKGAQGAQGEKGDAGEDGADGEDGVGITSVKQTTTSTADGGNNVITVTLSDGTTSTFNVKNGSKGSQGEKGEKGEKGDTGADGSAAYPLVNHGTSDTTFTLTPNTFHVWGAVSALTLTLGSETAGVANEYLFQFSCPSGADTTLSLPSGIVWAEDIPEIEALYTYQVSILNGCASLLKFYK